MGEKGGLIPPDPKLIIFMACCFALKNISGLP